MRDEKGGRESLRGSLPSSKGVYFFSHTFSPYLPTFLDSMWVFPSTNKVARLNPKLSTNGGSNGLKAKLYGVL